VEVEADRFRRDHRHHREAPVAVLVDGRVHALHTDHRGAPIAITNPDQKVIWRARYAPFGAAAINEDPDCASRDLADGNKTGERVLEMAKYLYRYLGQLQEAERSGIEINSTLNIDNVGFSRGAASAHIFANLIERFLAGDDEFLVTNNTGPFNDVVDFTSDHVVTDPIVNDAVYANPLYYPGRYFRYLDPGTDTDVPQRDDTVAESDRLSDTELRQDENGTYLYQQWLADHYGLNIAITNDSD
jgi:hypothetical protein